MAAGRDADYEPLLGPSTPDSISEQPSAPSLLDSLPPLYGLHDAQGRLAEWTHMGYSKSTGTPSVQPPEAEVSPTEVRNAVSHEPYPQWTAPPADTGYWIQPPNQPSVQALQDEDIREILVDYVSSNCCWGGKPAKKWDLEKVEDCNVYIGTLETFIEERNVLDETEPYTGGSVDGKDKGHTPAPWEVDVRKEFPLLFTPIKETSISLPHSEVIVRCSECSGRGEVACPICNAGKEPGTYHPGIMTECPDCYGRGLIAHQDGSDTHCNKCGGTGKLRCPACLSQGLIKCRICSGNGALLCRKLLLVRWRTLQNRKVSASSNAASVPDEIFHKAQGVELHSDVIAERIPVPPAARIICERHTLSYVPVTRVVMSHKGKSFKSYIVGLKKEVYMKDYPSRCCCGICCCQSLCCIL